MTFDPVDFVRTEYTYVGLRGSQLELIAMDDPRGGYLTLLYRQGTHNGQSESARATLQSSDSGVIAIQMHPWTPRHANPRHAKEFSDGQLPRRSLLVAGLVANRLDVVFYGYLREIEGLTIDPRTALSKVKAKLQSWHEDAESNPWWPGAITEPTEAPPLDLPMGNDHVTLRCFTMGRVLVSFPTWITIDDSQLEVVLAIRGNGASDLALYRLNPMDIVFGGYARLLLPP